MGILDRYIARQFLTNIILLFVVLFAFIIVIDFSLNFDEFLRFAEERLKARGEEVTALAKGLGAVQLELDLWLPRLPLLFNYLLGLVMVGAMGFTCAQMVQHREFVALLSGGISLRRAARPIIIVALAMLALTAVNREVLLPEIAPLLTRDKKDAGKRTLGMTQVSLSADGRGRLWQADRFDIDASRLEVVRVWERDADGLMTARITAAEATWDAQRRGWALKDGVAEDARAATPGGPMTRRAAMTSSRRTWTPPRCGCAASRATARTSPPCSWQNWSRASRPRPSPPCGGSSSWNASATPASPTPSRRSSRC